MRCEGCDAKLSVSVEEKENFFHIFEYCSYCGYTKAYVDYKDEDTGPLDYSGIEH